MSFFKQAFFHNTLNEDLSNWKDNEFVFFSVRISTPDSYAKKFDSNLVCGKDPLWRIHRHRCTCFSTLLFSHSLSAAHGEQITRWRRRAEEYRCVDGKILRWSTGTRSISSPTTISRFCARGRFPCNSHRVNLRRLTRNFGGKTDFTDDVTRVWLHCGYFVRCHDEMEISLRHDVFYYSSDDAWWKSNK